MTQMISLLGSTGSIGRQTLETAELLGLKIRALSADRSISLLEDQVRRYKPAMVAVNDEAACRDFRIRVADTNVQVVPGPGGLVDVACVDGADTVVVAVVGMAGLLPTLAAIGLGRRIALANKETLVCAGELVMKKAGESKAEIIPVDSEHSAIFQCIGSEPVDSVKRLILTASGGPFRGLSRGELEKATPEMALKHPTWNMGKKITIDSATLMNKGFEVIEAAYLYATPPEKISVVVHPESIVHSMVEFIDNSIMAQIAEPDMRLPIQYALTYPERKPSPAREFDVTRLSGLTFEEPQYDKFPCLPIALDALKRQGTACSVLNGANEAAVELFLRGDLGFYGISDVISAALEEIKHVGQPTLDDIIEAGENAKQFVVLQRK